MLLHLIRHGAYDLIGHTLGGRAPHPLSAAGQAQAARVAEALRGRPVAAVVASPLRRAQETAAPIAARLGLQVQTDPAFNEIDYAGWTGRRFDSLADDPVWQAWNTFRGTAGIPGGETMLQAQARAVAGMTALAAALPDQEVVVVSHADVIKAILVHVLGMPLDLMHRLEVGPASISQVRLYPADATVLCINQAP
ncbi:MAG TPA: histidine phosphatase family protein [Rhodopila sp.]|nr:histidine phosphatase family protein [Rhodopila sp.]